jgi:hypothetical protein
MKNFKTILILIGIIAGLVFLRSCDTTWNPIKNALGFKADTVHKVEWKEVLVPVPQIRIDTIPAIRYVIYPLYKDTTIFKIDSAIVAERDSLTLLLDKAGVKINMVCDTITPAKDSLPWIHFHNEYNEINRVFHNVIIDIKPVRAKVPEQTTTITNTPKFAIGLGAGYGFNSSTSGTEWRLGWHVGLQATYTIWSY